MGFSRLLCSFSIFTASIGLFNVSVLVLSDSLTIEDCKVSFSMFSSLEAGCTADGSYTLTGTSFASMAFLKWKVDSTVVFLYKPLYIWLGCVLIDRKYC